MSNRTGLITTISLTTLLALAACSRNDTVGTAPAAPPAPDQTTAVNNDATAQAAEPPAPPVPRLPSVTIHDLKFVSAEVSTDNASQADDSSSEKSADTPAQDKAQAAPATLVKPENVILKIRGIGHNESDNTTFDQTAGVRCIDLIPIDTVADRDETTLSHSENVIFQAFDETFHVETRRAWNLGEGEGEGDKTPAEEAENRSILASFDAALAAAAKGCEGAIAEEYRATYFPAAEAPTQGR